MENTFIYDLIYNYSYFVVVLLLFIENIFPPIPSEVILLSAGVVTKVLDLSIVFMIICATIGGYIGAILLYYVGYFFNQEKILKLIGHKYLKYLKIKPDVVNRCYEAFNKYGKKLIFFGRMLPVVRSLISIPAGSSKMNFLTFSTLTILGSLIWNTILILLGYYLANYIDEVIYYLDLYSHVAIIIMIVVAILFIYKYFIKK